VKMRKHKGNWPRQLKQREATVMTTFYPYFSSACSSPDSSLSLTPMHLLYTCTPGASFHHMLPIDPRHHPDVIHCSQQVYACFPMIVHMLCTDTSGVSIFSCFYHMHRWIPTLPSIPISVVHLPLTTRHAAEYFLL
jgi:hypothetical protein